MGSVPRGQRYLANNGWSSDGQDEMLPLTSRQLGLRKEVRIDV